MRTLYKMQCTHVYGEKDRQRNRQTDAHTTQPQHNTTRQRQPNEVRHQKPLSDKKAMWEREEKKRKK